MRRSRLSGKAVGPEDNELLGLMPYAHDSVKSEDADRSRLSACVAIYLQNENEAYP